MACAALQRQTAPREQPAAVATLDARAARRARRPATPSPRGRGVACAFCAIAAAEAAAYLVYEDERALAFLDHRPLFPGHTLLIPRAHVETLPDLPADEVGAFFGAARLLARALPEALAAEGTFVANNNRVSQSVPHLHVHIVARSRGDGLRGFFWPRRSYEGPEQMRAVQRDIRAAIERL